MSSTLAHVEDESTCATYPRIYEKDQDTSCLRNIDDLVLSNEIITEPITEENEMIFFDSTGISESNRLEHEDFAWAPYFSKIKNHYTFNYFNHLLLSEALLKMSSSLSLDDYATTGLERLVSRPAVFFFSSLLARNNQPEYLSQVLFTLLSRSRFARACQTFSELERESALFTQEARKFLRNQPMLEHIVRSSIRVVKSAIIMEEGKHHLLVTLKVDPESGDSDLRLVIESENPDFDELTNLWERLSKEIHDKILEIGEENNLSTTEIDSILDTFTLSVVPKRN